MGEGARGDRAGEEAAGVLGGRSVGWEAGMGLRAVKGEREGRREGKGGLVEAETAEAGAARAGHPDHWPPQPRADKVLV